jgi:hypothetical protein
MERPAAGDLLGGPGPTGGLQHHGAGRVGHQEAVVVAEPGVVPAARPALAVAFEQLDEHPHRVVGGGGPLEGQAEQVHAEQAGGGHRGPGEHGLVADDHAVLVGAHLGAPHPPRLREHHGVGVGHLRHEIQVHDTVVPGA